jgi:hypothetical protein
MLVRDKHCSLLDPVANAKFSLLKLLTYEPIYCALVGWSAKPRLEPLQAIGTIRALPRPPSTRLGCHATCTYCFILWTRFSLLGTEFPLSIVHTVFHRVKSSFLV